MENSQVEVFDASESNFQLCGYITVAGRINIDHVKCDNMLSGRGVRIIQKNFYQGVSICEIDFYGIKL